MMKTLIHPNRVYRNKSIKHYTIFWCLLLTKMSDRNSSTDCSESSHSPPTEPTVAEESGHHLHWAPCRPAARLSQGLAETVSRGCCHRPGCSSLRRYWRQCPQTQTRRRWPPRTWWRPREDRTVGVMRAVPPCCQLLPSRWSWLQADSEPHPHTCRG